MSGRFSNTSAKPRSRGQVAELRARVGDDGEAAGAGGPLPGPLEVAAGLDRGARLRRRRGAACARAGTSAAIRAMAAGSVVSSTCRRGRPGAGAEGAGEHLGEQARAAHAHHDDVVDAVDERVAPRRRGAGRSASTSPTTGIQPEAVGDLGGVVPPERVVAVEQAAHGVALDEVGRRVGVGRAVGRTVERHRRAAYPVRRSLIATRRSRRPRRAAAPTSSMTSSVWARPGNMTS